ncbi:segregation/condensation protein A [Haloimpatiens sp. FM7315]|uniref:segregation/condensation protein A n=1 Tax=Haloimpatiens sp. FM7315 TaxID=3298609 RepID=UPI00370BDC77
MVLKIKINNFEGPFDLLLHLIKKNEMDICNIKIYEITEQYMEYLKDMKEMDLEITSEFIVIAATLLEIKSKLLLPKVENEDNKEEEDLREQLVKKLLEYNKFKKVSSFLKDREVIAGMVFSKSPDIIEDKKEVSCKEFLKNVTMLDLFNLYNNLIDRYFNKLNKNNLIQENILIDNYKLEDKMALLRYKISKTKKIKFTNIINECERKMEVVVTFLALLELMRLKVIKAFQENNFQEIYIERIEGNEDINGTN